MFDILYQPFRTFDRLSDRFVGAVVGDATGRYERVVGTLYTDGVLNT